MSVRTVTDSKSRLRWMLRLIGPLALLAIWQLGSMTGLIPEKTLASPGTVASTAWDLIRTGELQHHLWVSLQRVLKGLAIGVVLGTAFGIVSGLFRAGEEIVDAPIQMLRTMPHLALIPLFILWFGIGEEPKIYIVALGVFFPIYINVYAGIRNVDAKLVEAGQTFGLRRAGLVRDVMLPGALPQGLVGLRLAIGIAWLTLVVGEQINANSGIGYLMMQAREFLRTDIIVVGLVVYSLLGLTADLLVRLLERRLLSWRAGFAGT